MASLVTLLSVAIVSLLFHTTSTDAAVNYDVVQLGAKADGKTDSSKAFLTAWASACASSKAATINVPAGRFLVKTTIFQGPCKNSATTFKIKGTLVAPSDYNVIGNVGYWILFRSVTGVRISGGVLDGQGTGLWACKAAGKSCPTGASSLEFTNSNNIFISGLSSLNSQMFHIVLNACENVKVQGVKVTAAGNSPNTDGIHVEKSTGVTIVNSKIATGDDCISIGPGTNNLWIENISCGPGHGISIGSLGKTPQEAGVHNVSVSTVKFSGTQNGVRIKSWGRPSTGFVTNILFQHVLMMNVQNPIIIDQNYCPNNQGCPNEESGVKITNVTYQDIHGTSATEVALKLDCSSKNPCTGITLQDVNLTYKNKVAQASCNNAGGTASGYVQPSSCL